MLFRSCSGGFNGGSGGGHGTAGTIGPTSSSGRVCTSGGPAFGSATDSAVAAGGPGGGVSGSSTPGSPGGGMLRLIASSRLVIAGQMTADGQPGQRAEGSRSTSAGGGAGGGILLAGDEVIVGGAVSAQGAPTGGGTWGGPWRRGAHQDPVGVDAVGHRIAHGRCSDARYLAAAPRHVEHAS